MIEGQSEVMERQDNRVKSKAQDGWALLSTTDVPAYGRSGEWQQSREV
jgi:hypothetical protein